MGHATYHRGIDGKHIAMDYPKNTGSLYHNYKGFFSFVLLAICDARYSFTFVDVGQYGPNNDSGVLKESTLGQGFKNGSFKYQNPEKIPGYSLRKVPYFLVADEIFSLQNWLMCPYPGKEIHEISTRIKLSVITSYTSHRKCVWYTCCEVENTQRIYSRIGRKRRKICFIITLPS